MGLHNVLSFISMPHCMMFCRYQSVNCAHSHWCSVSGQFPTRSVSACACYSILWLHCDIYIPSSEWSQLAQAAGISLYKDCCHMVFTNGNGKVDVTHTSLRLFFKVMHKLVTELVLEWVNVLWKISRDLLDFKFWRVCTEAGVRFMHSWQIWGNEEGAFDAKTAAHQSQEHSKCDLWMTPNSKGLWQRGLGETVRKSSQKAAAESRIVGLEG